MNSDQLYNHLEAMFGTTRCKYDVLPAEFLNSVNFKSHFNMFYIFNNQTSKFGGQHWLALCKKDNRIEFFDSYGLGLRFYGKHFVNFKKKYVVHENNKKLQSIYSNVCGQFCLFYLYYRHKGYTMHEIEKMFTSDSVRNDKIVKQFVFRKKCTCLDSKCFIQICQNQCETINM